jgi:hypothetical protein
MKVLNLRLHFAANLLSKSLMIIASWLTAFVQFYLDLALALLNGGSRFSNGLLPLVVACLEETYILK